MQKSSFESGLAGWLGDQAIQAGGVETIAGKSWIFYGPPTRISHGTVSRATTDQMMRGKWGGLGRDL